MGKGMVALVGVLIALVFVVGWFFMRMHYRNAEVRLRNAVAAKQDVNRASYDTMWKILKQKAQIPDQYKEAFKEVHTEILKFGVEGRKGGSLMKFVTEANPNFDAKDLYKDLSVAIEAERKRFFRDQEELRALKQAHDDVIGTEPGSWFVGDRGKIEVVLITSSQTEETFKTGKEDDINLFPAKKPEAVEKK